MADVDEVPEDGKGGVAPWTVMKWILGAVALGLAIYFFEAYELRSRFSTWFRNDVQAWLRAHPILAPFAYMGIYIVAVVAFMPGSVITLVGGGLFGYVLGTIYVSIASTLAAGIAFLIARYVAVDWVESRATGKLDTIKKGIEEDGARFVAFTRLVPIFPYSLLNYMFGLTKINFWTYFFVTWLCMLPGTFAYVYAGYAAKVAAAGSTGVKNTIIVITIAVGLLVLASMIPKFVRMVTDDEVEEIVDDETDNQKEAMDDETTR